MTANPVVCPECGSAVPSGRLSCTSCGALLASVTGAGRRAIARAAPDRADEASDEDRPIGGAEPEPAARAESEPEAEPEAPSDAATLPVAPPAAQPAPAAERPPGPAIPGAYLAPSATFAAPIAPPPRPASSAGVPGASAGPPPVASGAPSALSRFTVAIPHEVPDWLAIAGSALAVASFLLPWATDGVIGASGIGYFANWGLANPGHLLLVLAAGVVLVLHIFPNRLPGWIRTGVLPLVVGGVLLGLAFAYHARPFGGGTGVTVLLVAALVLLIGGLLGVRPGRSESGPPSV